MTRSRLTLPYRRGYHRKASIQASYRGQSQEISQSTADSQRECPILSKARRYLTSSAFLRTDDLRKVITISNPLGEDYSIMRTSTLNGMLASLATNYNRRNKDVRLYELGNIYLPKSLPVTELPDERTMFTLGMYGNGDFFDMKGVCEEFFEKIGMKKKVYLRSEQREAIPSSWKTGKYDLRG